MTSEAWPLSGLPLITVAGPTASGKSALAVHLAEALNGEIVSCDSVAVYRELEIGSAKPTAEQRTRVPHHGLDLYWPDEHCTAGDWARHAREALAGIRERGRVPVIAGGTGLYLRALLRGLAPSPKRDEALRTRLREEAEERGAEHLHARLAKVDAAAAKAIHANDVPKIIRALEVAELGGEAQTEQWKQGRDALRGYRVLQLGLDGERAALYARINERAAEMFERGLVEETAVLRERYGDECRTLGSLGYAQAMGVLQGALTLEDAVSAAQQGHRNYAKRQRTWFRSEPEMVWLAGFGDEDAVQREALGRARAWVQG